VFHSAKANEVVKDQPSMNILAHDLPSMQHDHPTLASSEKSNFGSHEEYLLGLARAFEVFDSQPGTALFDELSILLVEVSNYEQRYVHFPAMKPQEVVQHRMASFDLPQSFLSSKVGGDDKFNRFLNGGNLPSGDMKKLYKALGLQFPLIEQHYFKQH